MTLTLDLVALINGLKKNSDDDFDILTLIYDLEEYPDEDLDI